VASGIGVLRVMIEGTTINRPSRTENALPTMAITAEIVIPIGRYILLGGSAAVVRAGFQAQCDA
jgi:hypothetical protein